jgi:lipopolysaccharide biosynthesis glycosyltransferase
VDVNHNLAVEMVKVHSLLKSTNRQDELYFGFLVADKTQMKLMKDAIEQCGMNISYSVRVMEGFPPFMLEIFKKDARSRTTMYRPGYFARYLLPEAFPECDYYLYLDNDMFMNLDIVTDVFEAILLNQPVTQESGDQNISSFVGFVFDANRKRLLSRQADFNSSHPYIMSKGIPHIPSNQFINAGMWMCNASEWRRLRVTEELWAVIELAQTEPIFLAWGKPNKYPNDQDVAFVVLGARASHLPMHLNIRNNVDRMHNPFDAQKELGIMHMAGAKQKVCTAKYPKKPMALMISVVHSLSRQCGISPRLLDACQSLSGAFRNERITLVDRGLGGFVFPPAEDFVYLPNPIIQ